MDLEKSDLHRAAAEGILGPEEVDPLWTFLQQTRKTSAGGFGASSFLWYAGTGLVFVALATLSYHFVLIYTGYGLAASAALVAAVFALMAWLVRAKTDLRVLYGVLLTGIVLMVAPFVLGWQVGRLDPDTVRWPSDFLVEAGSRNPYPAAAATAAASLALLRWSRFLFLVVPLLLAVWAMAAKLLGTFTDLSGRDIALVIAGLTMAGTWAADLRSAWNIGFWMQKCATVLLLFPIIDLFADGTEAGKLAAVAICLAMIGFGVLTHRTSGVYVASLVLYGYVVHLVYDLIRSPVFASLGVVLIGLGMVVFGWWLHERSSAIGEGRWALRPPERRDSVAFGAA
jgi:hypothetical protein